MKAEEFEGGMVEGYVGLEEGKGREIIAVILKPQKILTKVEKF